MDGTGGGGWLAGWLASGWLRRDGWDAGGARIYPTAIRRVAVIEVIAILCPVRAPALSSPCPRPTLFPLPSFSTALATPSPRMDPVFPVRSLSWTRRWSSSRIA